MPTESLRLAIEIADAADRAAACETFDVDAEAHRIAERHPDAPVGQEEVAEVLREETERSAA